MPPLACSLFALAALLATAHGNCYSKDIGRKTDTEHRLPPVAFPPPLTIYDEPSVLGRCPLWLDIVGAHIAACNNDPDGLAPDIVGPLPGTLFPVLVLCDEGDCPDGGSTQVVLYCGDPIKH